MDKNARFVKLAYISVGLLVFKNLEHECQELDLIIALDRDEENL